MKKLQIFCLALGIVIAISGTVAFGGKKIKQGVPEYEVTEIENLQYGPYLPGNLLDLYLPDVPGNAKLPLVIWHSGSAWFSNTAKDSGSAVAAAKEFTARGYAVAAISIRSSFDARFPAQGHDVRAAIRWLRENADEYGIDPNRFAFRMRFQINLAGKARAGVAPAPGWSV